MKRGLFIVGALLHFIQIPVVGLAQDSLPFKPRLSLKLTGGLRAIAIGDMNIHLASINDALIYPDGNGSAYSTDKVNLFNHLAGNWEAELRLEISKHAGIGFGFANPLHLVERTDILLYPAFSSSSIPIGSLSCSPEIDVRSPIKVNFSYRLPALSRTYLVLVAGLGHYSVRMKESLDYEISSHELVASWYRSHWVTDWKSTIGFHGGAGAEYGLSRLVSFVFDLHYRSVKTRSFQATMNIDTTAPKMGSFYDEHGDLYRWVWGEGGTLNSFYKEFFVWSGEPPQYTFQHGGSDGKARLDMSGFSMSLGIKVNLF